jgi:hypothetical protein
MDEALKRYYAGFPEEAISMLKPLALSGDADAQLLLGNILYSLSKAGGITDIDDPVKWYKMAADQNSAAANYALGAIFHNKWIKSRNKNEAANAIIYYQAAVGLGYSKAQQPLDRIKSRSRLSPETAAVLVKEQEIKSIPKPESRAQKPEIDLSSSESDESQAPDSSALTRNHKTTKSETLDKPEVAARDPIEIAKTADKPVDEVTLTVTLEDIATQCQNYTETGFNLYAETIEGALFSGKASVLAVKPDASEPGTFLVNFSSKLFGLVVFVDLRDVPKQVAVKFAEGKMYAITGIIVNSKVVGSDCAVRAMYQ